MKMDHEQQMAQAEEVLGEGMHAMGFAKGLFFGHYLARSCSPTPISIATRASARWSSGCASSAATMLTPPRSIARPRFRNRSSAAGPARRARRVPAGRVRRRRPEPDVVLPADRSARRTLRQHGAVRQRASLDRPAALVLFGTREQQAQWLPKMASGEWISAFALTEPEAGSDAANVQTTATPTADGRGYLLNGQKRWITNGGIAPG